MLLLAHGVIAPDARIEYRKHFEALVRLGWSYGLGGKQPTSMVEFHDFSAGPPASLLADPPVVRTMLEVLLNAQRCAVGGRQICDVTSREERRTYDLSLAILHEENAHEACVSAFLGHRPSGHDSRAGWPNSPDARKFPTAGQQVSYPRSMPAARRPRRACRARWHGAAPRRSCGLPRPCV